MKQLLVKSALYVALFATLSALPACNNNDYADDNEDSAAAMLPDTAIMNEPPVAVPVTISPADSMSTSLADATKDFPGVTATANNGEVTLTGTIERSRLPALMQAVNQLKPQKVNNNLTIK